MEGLLRNLSRACKEAAAVTTIWVRNTHHSLQRQEFRWEWVKQEVREQKKEIQNLIVESHCTQKNHDRYEERLRQLENLVCKQEQALVEQGKRCENGAREGKLRECLVSKTEGKSLSPRLA